MHDPAGRGTARKIDAAVTNARRGRLFEAAPIDRICKRGLEIRCVLIAARPGPGRRAVGQRLQSQQLRDREPSAVEGIGHPRHIEAPDTVALGTGRGDGRLAVLLQSAQPMQQRSRVMRPQILDIEDLQPGPGDLVNDPRRCGSSPPGNTYLSMNSPPGGPCACPSRSPEVIPWLSARPPGFRSRAMVAK